MSSLTRPLRSHQQQLLAVVQAIAAGEASDVRDVLAAVTPGGGKSLLPVLAAHVLVGAGIVERVVWVVPRDSLRLQAEEAFADPYWRATLGHTLAVRAAENAPDPCRGLAGYVTTYQGVAAAPNLHLAEARRHRTLLVVDEVHHLPAPGDAGGGASGKRHAGDGGSPDPQDEAAGWSAALLPLLECARVRLLLSGTLERADGHGILWLPYRRGPRASTREVDLAAPGWAVVGYSRAQALTERAVLPVLFGALDGEARWLDHEAKQPDGAPTTVGPHRLAGGWPTETTRPALFTALRTGFADQLLREAFDATRALRACRREARGLAPGTAAQGLGKLLVVAPDQTAARRYLDVVRAWVPRGQRETVRLATSDERDAHETLASFRLRPEPSALVTVAMAYEGLDVPEVAVVAALTHSRGFFACAKHCSATDVVILLGRNDIAAVPRTAAQLKADIATLAAPYLASAMRVRVATVPPTTSSTDGWTTPGNQFFAVVATTTTAAVAAGATTFTPSSPTNIANGQLFALNAGTAGIVPPGTTATISGGVVTLSNPIGGAGIAAGASVVFGQPTPITNETTRTSYNADLRATFASYGYTGVIDVAAAVEDGANPGKWLTTGGVAYTIDGVHPNPTGHNALVTAGVIAPSLFPAP